MLDVIYLTRFVMNNSNHSCACNINLLFQTKCKECNCNIGKQISHLTIGNCMHYGSPHTGQRHI